MKYLSLFSGIGTAEMGIEQAYEQRTSDFIHGRSATESQTAKCSRSASGESDNLLSNGHVAECIGYAEIDRFASSIYKYHWPDVRNYGDATKIICDELPDFDFLVGGFPCQSFSIAGKRQGFNEARGTLFFEIARILSHKRPRHFLLENVKGLLSSDDGKVYTTILRILSDLDYRVETVVLNSKHYGVPQNRERVFIIGHSRNGCVGEVLSFGDGNGESDEVQRASGSERQWLSVDTESLQRDQSCLESWRDRYERYGDSVTVGTLRTHKDGQGFREMQSNVAPTLNARARADGSGDIEQSLEPRFDGCTNSLTSVEKDNLVAITPPGTPQRQRIYGETGLSPALPAGATGGNNEPRIAFTDRRIRRLTPTECERLQGLPDGHTKYGINDKGERYEVSDSQRYKTLGNAMTVNVIAAVINKMLAVGCLDGNEEAHRTNVLPVV